MAKKQEKTTQTTEREATGVKERKERLDQATEELVRSLWRLGVAVAASPLELLPRETRRHLRAASRETIRAGLALNRGALRAMEDVLEQAEARLDRVEARLEKEKGE